VPPHGYGIARRTEQISADRFQLNQGTMYPALFASRADGMDQFQVGVSENKSTGEVLLDYARWAEAACS
jgi:PadR family transcriptional regulator PadR